MEKRIWFKRKEYGWGWFPATWQGWTILLVFLALVVLPSLFLPRMIGVHLTLFLVDVFSLSGILIYLCWRNGESPKWQWGDKNYGSKI